MKKIRLFLFILILSIIFSIPPIFALQNNSGIKSTNDEFSIYNDGIYFENLDYDYYGNAANEEIGFMGNITNFNSNKIELQVDIFYYDVNQNVIASDLKNVTIDGNTTIYYNLHSLASDLNVTATDIKYYQLSFSILSGKIDANIDNPLVDNNESNSNVIPSIDVNTNKDKNSLQLLYPNNDYVINSYDVNVIVNEDNTFDITETITAYFNTPRHGIYRIIPMVNSIERLDSTKSFNSVIISNLEVNNEYSTSKQDGNYKIQIGSPNRTVTGEQIYVIRYKYDIGRDPLKNIDEFYYNIIGDKWDTIIGNVTFSITMPKDFDKSKLGFSSGIKGSTSNENVKYDIKDNVISGYYDGILNAGEALTVRCELPKGYFSTTISDYVIYLIYLLPIFFVLISIFIWYKYGRDKKVVEIPTFYPPEEFNSLEVGFLYKGKADIRDVTSLLIYLANKGYVEIIETDENSLFSKTKSFKIRKLRDYDGNNINEKLFLDGLFASANSFENTLDNNNVIEVKLEDLYNRFYITINQILTNINSKENKNKIFEPITSSKKIIIILLIIATYLVITLPPFIIYDADASWIFSLIFPGFGFTLLFKFMIGSSQTIYVNGKPTNSLIATKLFGLLWGLGFGGIPWFFIVFPILNQNLFFLIAYFFGLLCVFGMMACLEYLPKRTAYGNEILGKLYSFKKYLETTEKSRLESMVFQNPNYCYDILPYAYVLDVSDKWIKNFEIIGFQSPKWCNSSTIISAATFATFINSTMVSATSAMGSSPYSSSSSSSSSSGGSSGGGSSGSGSSGGGGGSW